MKAFNSPTVLIFIAALLMLCGLNEARAQRIQISAQYIQGIRYTSNWDAFKGGTELSADYIIPAKNWNYSIGAHVRTVQWGSQLGLSLGITKAIDKKIEIGAEIQNGIALFRQKPLYTFSAGVKGNYLFRKREKSVLGLSVEVRYTNTPAYKDYSLIYSLVEIPMGVFIRF